MSEVATRPGFKFVCDIPKGYEKVKVSHVNDIIVLTPLDGMHPPIKWDGELKEWVKILPSA